MYGNFGYGGMGGYGGYGGMGGMGGNETMIISLCCLCCLCVAALIGGYWGNFFCSLSPGLGRSCEPAEPDPNETLAPDTSTVVGPSVKTCSESWGKTVRIGNDPRPPIRPEYCTTETRAIGRDCYYWEVQRDPVTGMARWMRKADDAYGDMRSGGTCVAQVQCPNRIDPAVLDRYSETEPDQLLRQCTAVAGTATNEADTLATLTAEAAKVGATWVGPYVWTSQHSKTWYDGVLRYVGQKDLKAYITNSRRAADALKYHLRSNTLDKSTFAYMLEAAVRAPTNSPEWIINTTNAFTGSSEAAYVAHLQRYVKGLQPWERWLEGAYVQRDPKGKRPRDHKGKR